MQVGVLSKHRFRNPSNKPFFSQSLPQRLLIGTPDKEERRCEMCTGADMHRTDIPQPKAWYKCDDAFPCSIKGFL